MTTVLDRQRAAKLTDAQFVGLDLLITRGAARRVRAGWCFSSMDGPIIAPATMDALVNRGLAAHQRFMGVQPTQLGRDTHAQVKRGVA